LPFFVVALPLFPWLPWQKHDDGVPLPFFCLPAAEDFRFALFFLPFRPLSPHMGLALRCGRGLDDSWADAVFLVCTGAGWFLCCRTRGSFFSRLRVFFSRGGCPFFDCSGRMAFLAERGRGLFFFLLHAEASWGRCLLYAAVFPSIGRGVLSCSWVRRLSLFFSLSRLRMKQTPPVSNRPLSGSPLTPFFRRSGPLSRAAAGGKGRVSSSVQGSYLERALPETATGVLFFFVPVDVGFRGLFSGDVGAAFLHGETGTV